MRTHLIKVIHTLKSTNGISEECYRGILSDMFGVESSKELDERELYALAQRFGYAVPLDRINKKGKCTHAQENLINSIFYEIAREKTPLALRNFINRIIGRRPLYLNDLSIKEAQKVIIALKEWQKRV